MKINEELDLAIIKTKTLLTTSNNFGVEWMVTFTICKTRHLTRLNKKRRMTWGIYLMKK